MLSPDCCEGAADNSAEKHVYYVRLPGDCLDGLPVREKLADGENVRVLTGELSVKAMHEKAAAIRAAGKAVFFAALRG